jgi:uncharacterized protein
MDVKAKWYKLDDQKPIVQLITSFVLIVVFGTVIYYLFVFAGSLLFGTTVSEIIGAHEIKIDEAHEGILKYNQFAQEIAMFVIPGLILATIFKKGNESYLKINSFPETNFIILVVLLALAMIPVTMYTGILNSKMVLPERLAWAEEWIRSKEDTASSLTSLFIKSSGRWELLLNIIIMALLPSLAEEIIFRGVLQRIFCGLFRSFHVGIWVTAIIFSSIHLQFYGFIPRLILGLSFGYLFYWSGNLWLPVTAHFINNLVPVLIAYTLGWEQLNEKTSQISGVRLAVPLASLFICFIILYHFRSEFKKKISINLDTAPPTGV